MQHQYLPNLRHTGLFCRASLFRLPQRTVTLLLVILLPACSLLQPQVAPPASQQQHDAQLSRLQCWDLTAKIGIRTYAGAESARVNWQQLADSYSITISGPLGIGAARIRGDAERVVMHTEKNRMLMARTPEVLIREELGWELPVSNLHYWVRGLPAPDSDIDAELRDPNGLLLNLEQDGWLLEIDRHVAVHGLFLPERIRLTHPDIMVRLIIKEWDLPGCRT